MGYFKVRAREQFVAPNEKADEINARVKCNHRLILCLRPELLLLFFLISALVQRGAWVLISGASITHLFCAALVFTQV